MVVSFFQWLWGFLKDNYLFMVPFLTNKLGESLGWWNDNFGALGWFFVGFAGIGVVRFSLYKWGNRSAPSKHDTSASMTDDHIREVAKAFINRMEGRDINDEFQQFQALQLTDAVFFSDEDWCRLISFLTKNYPHHPFGKNGQYMDKYPPSKIFKMGAKLNINFGDGDRFLQMMEMIVLNEHSVCLKSISSGFEIESSSPMLDTFYSWIIKGSSEGRIVFVFKGDVSQFSIASLVWKNRDGSTFSDNSDSIVSRTVNTIEVKFASTRNKITGSTLDLSLVNTGQIDNDIAVH